MTPHNKSTANLDEATLSMLEELCSNVEAPWSLVPCSETITETIILHDANGIAIADLYTEGEPTDVDRLIALAPNAITDLVSEVRRLRAKLEPPKLVRQTFDRIRVRQRQTFDCIRCGKKDVPGGTFGGYCAPCDDAVANGAPAHVCDNGHPITSGAKSCDRDCGGT